MEAPGSHPPKKFHSAGKVMTSFFLESQWVIMIDNLEDGRTINFNPMVKC